MRIIDDIKLDYDDVLIRPKRSTLTSRKDVNLEREFKFLHSKKKWTGIPIMSANMESSGTFSVAKVLSQHKMITTLHKFHELDDLEKGLKELNAPNYLAYTLGIREEDFEKAKKVIEKGLHKYFDFVCLDVPNAYLEVVVEKVVELRKMFKEHIIIAGNLVSNEMAEELLIKGADIVKIGIGPGSACTTRRKTGVGYPQLSAVIECSDAAHGISNENGCGLVIADGGLVYPSDFAKAFCGGADFVMSGSNFSGFEQSGGETVEKDGKKYKLYVGSSSSYFMKKHYTKIDKHRASEGRVLEIPHKGDMNDFIQDLLGSLRSTATYIGARKLKEFSKRATFIRVNKQLNTSLERYEK